MSFDMAQRPPTVQAAVLSPRSPSPRWIVGAMAERVGGGVRRLLGCRPHPVADRRWGYVMAAGVVALWVGWVPVAVAATTVVVVSAAKRRSAVRHAHQAVMRTLPDAVDLLQLGAEADLTVLQAVTAVADHGLGPVANSAAVVVAQANRGVRLGDALEHLRTEPALIPIADALIDAER